MLGYPRKTSQPLNGQFTVGIPSRFMDVYLPSVIQFWSRGHEHTVTSTPRKRHRGWEVRFIVFSTLRHGCNILSLIAMTLLYEFSIHVDYQSLSSK